MSLNFFYYFLLIHENGNKQIIRPDEFLQAFITIIILKFINLTLNSSIKIILRIITGGELQIQPHIIS